MKKVFKLQNLECAHCASKMEEGIGKLEGVENVRVNFLTQKLTLEADERIFTSLVEEAAKIIRKIEPDCSIIR